MKGKGREGREEKGRGVVFKLEWEKEPVQIHLFDGLTSRVERRKGKAERGKLEREGEKVGTGSVGKNCLG